MQMFQIWKSERLVSADMSRKGSIDKEVRNVVELVNKDNSFFTTSSCSGRIVVFSQNGSTTPTKKGCNWLYVTHDLAEADKVVDVVRADNGDAVFKFEPMILHVQCESLEDAKLMHQTAVASGFRNSGITIGKPGKISTAVRSTHGLEVPLSHNGTLLVSHDYISFLVNMANRKMEENLKQIERFQSNLDSALRGERGPFVTHKTNQKTRAKKLPEDSRTVARQVCKASQTCAHVTGQSVTELTEIADLFTHENSSVTAGGGIT